ncbi:MAG TPA: cytochrome-c oxidase, cbb3-type subunit III [Plasticicumulans sp.]|uniref:cytochrome-c oxidase, cbb3-type subunit III n=1 Tax=Plasticicumulans sp. TaxID=2307179 RepID=UPI002CA3CD6F|nr:cytochrome-c oxidase, cbb3-type subunit III [Plasticicumulans sp.]MBS0602022.1 cytochrome-c oxidase, cbb3-type subunit III [Pseudomonadota bacterium]HMW30392.1 cytochrome-c oxidase, cbb3-type subunit III [Plasticicumulans sp.]HMX53280.1 cytochrome-c oxidase, cbb3-type subunit III [Plasticicumulans sp.]HMZ11230.1 cytochrome-c oxidase, cbb3-type subunit III [Plasticicumulans sp.]HNE00338.1 cytochrome-c oxidase, cbb3-type subunit III [Plasticicumulans sp.]
MSLTVSLYITLIVVGNTLAMWWLIRWTAKPRPNESVQGEVTGHTWDGDLAEFNNPMPRWWLWMFYLTMVFTGVYVALYPGLGSVTGFLGWTQEGQWQSEMKDAADKYDPIFKKYAGMDIAAVAKDPQALKMGGRLFATYCSSCHGSDAHGAVGFPNLADKDWLYGGDPATIKTSIMNGRQGVMPAWSAILKEQGVEQVANYVLSLSGKSVDAAKAEAGKALFLQNCAVCHGAEGKGNPVMGAPNLADNTWLYGGSLKAVEKTIADGRQGRMPAHADFLGNDKVHLLAAYVYSLSQ